MRKSPILPLSVAFTTAWLMPTVAHAAEHPQVSFDTSLFYDSNVFRVETGTLANRDSWANTARVNVVTELCPDAKLSYTADQTWFWDESREDFGRQIVSLSTKGESDAWSWKANASACYVAGDRTGPVYDCGKNAFATTQVRGRREQWIGQAGFSLKRELDHGFVRLQGNYQMWDFHVEPDGRAGYDRYADRAYMEMGPELGWTIRDGLNGLIGFRLGHQTQDRDGAVSARPSDRSNNYSRLLLGVEGKVGESLDLKAVVGPSIYRYSSQSVGPDRIDGLYLEIGGTWRIEKSDSINFSACLSQGVSSTGLVSDEEGGYALSWSHELTNRLSFKVGEQLLTAFYDGVNRDDVLWSQSLDLLWKQDARWSCRVGVKYDLGQDWTDANDPGRDYDRVEYQIGVSCKL